MSTKTNTTNASIAKLKKKTKKKQAALKMEQGLLMLLIQSRGMKKITKKLQKK